MDELIEALPQRLRKVFKEIAALTDACCDQHLSESYKDLCQEMAAAVCIADLPVTRGKIEGWACGVTHAVGWMNFLSDPNTQPYMSSEELAKAFGISQATMSAKFRLIRDRLGLFRLHPSWCLPELMDDNPMIWMLEVNGFLMDIRDAPREAQEVAFDEGLIPYIPVDTEPDPPHPDAIIARIGPEGQQP